MPLIKKPGKRAFKANLQTELAAKKPIKQALGGERDSKMAAAIRRGKRR